MCRYCCDKLSSLAAGQHACCLQLWHRKVDTKCLMAWNDNLVVLSFRGTASFRNVLADVKVQEPYRLEP
jgi:hypothetical protein